MTEPTKTSPEADKPAMTVAQAAKQVRRPVTTVTESKAEDGTIVKKSTIKKVTVEANEVLDFKDFGTHVVVVTKDGQKFSSADE